MSCEKCNSLKHVRLIRGIGYRCFNCFEDEIMKMIEFQENWLEADIMPEIKVDISDKIMENGENFDLKEYIENSDFNVEIMESAIEEMLQGNALPEVVRVCLNRYMGNIMDYVDGESYDESE